jgi:hypothetical protein
MLSRIQISSFLILAVAAWTVLLWVRGFPLSWELFWPFSLVLSFVGLTAAAFDRWFWKLQLLQGWFVKRPDISGTWRVALRSEWVNPRTGEKVPVIDCYMAVKQTLSTLNMRLLTPESSSWFIAHNITLSDDDVYQVAGVYMNKPKLPLRGDRSEIHYGAVLLDIQGTPAKSLEGDYWTDRNSRGTIRLSDRKKEVFATYEQAHAAFAE